MERVIRRRKRLIKNRAARLILGGVSNLVIWLFTLQINGYGVIRHLERFALYDDGRYLLAAAVSLVLLNTIRAAPLYLGWFFIGEGVSYMKSGRAASWVIPLIAIPSTYAAVSRYTGSLSLHFGSPALFCILSVCIMHFSTREIRSWLARSLVLFMLVFSFQWLDVAPALTRWGFGGGELSMAVKTMSLIDEWDWVIDALAMVIFFTAFAGGIVAAVLLIGINILNVQYIKLRSRDIKIAEMREKAVADRGYREIQQLVHDLRRPLTTVLGLADVMAETLPGGIALEHSKRIVKTGGSMNQMIEELLQEDARQFVAVAELVEYIKSQISAFDWRHIVAVHVDEEISEQVICVNQIRFSRAIVNLLDNARLAVALEKKPCMNFSVRGGESGLLFIIEDNGRGFSDKFFEREGFSEWRSTGIGLAFVSEVVKNHEGTVNITNLPAGGASVTINLPVREV